MNSVISAQLRIPTPGASNALRRARSAKLVTDASSAGVTVTIAATFLSRFVGLLSRRTLEPATGLLLIPGGTIHTLGMRFSIDAVFLDDRLRILRAAGDISPNRFRVAPRGTSCVVELGAGTAKTLRWQAGTQLQAVIP
jgi:uncharacterized membrane protein (UPF0127 family)